MTQEEVIKAQIILGIIRAYQSASISIAIKISMSPLHPLFLHLEDTQYFMIISDISKLFDKAGDNLESLLEIYKKSIKHTEFSELKNEIDELKTKHKKLIVNILQQRNKLVSHIDLKWMHKTINSDVADEIEIKLIETQALLRELINILHKASFFTEKDKKHLASKIEANDAQVILGL